MEFGVSLINVSSLHELLTNLPELLAPLYSSCMPNSIKIESLDIIGVRISVRTTRLRG
ncbi:unnamed protein product [Penicillium roqueforti FM164]|uniref:Uncharacterized protein n=1 Tax=Penicillium roqueforti (strain FM164) TaxID=1365484 RepID=W6R868_PENRF|nr:unnamed protein product [Penicillium roqueforti FM164]